MTKSASLDRCGLSSRSRVLLDQTGNRGRELGADATINYRVTPQWDDAVLRLTDGLGVDLVVEVGGAQTFGKSIAATRDGGRISVVGLLTGAPSPGEGFFTRGLSIAPIRVGSRQDFESMNRAIDLHKLRPVIDSVYDFAHVPDALRHLESQKHFGKIVVRHQQAATA